MLPVTDVSVSGAGVPTALRVRQCYNRSLQHNPKSQGQLRLTIEVQPDGAVHSVTATPSGTLSEATVSYVAARSRAAQFTSTDTGNATVSATVTFAPP